MGDLRADIISTLGLSAPDELKLVEECMEVCRVYNISPQDLLFKWEAIKFNSRANALSELQMPFNMSSIEVIKQELNRNLAAAAKAAAPRQNKRGALAQRGSRIPPMARQTFQKAARVEQDAGTSSVDIVVSNTIKPYRYMFEKISERSEILDDRLDEFATLVREHYKLSELGDPNIATDESVHVVGRIALDVENTIGPSKLNESSICLESSRAMGSGARVPLRFDSQITIRDGPTPSPGGAGFFPGAIVALRGKNGGAGWFQVEELLTLPSLPIPTAIKSENPRQFSVCVAQGPYSADTDLEFKPWRKLLKQIQSTQPDVTILIGPFIDASHPKIKDGDLDTTIPQSFADTFLSPLQDYLLTSSGRQIILVPSVRDIISNHVVFPQGPFPPECSPHPRIHLVSNPAQFALDGISFGVTSVDVLFHLRKEEYFKRTSVAESATSDAMVNLCRHLLQQRSFYPLFPSPADLSHEVNLDVTHWNGLKVEGQHPRVLILPSRLKPFVRMVDEIMVINPGFLSKGTFGVLHSRIGADDTKELFKTDLVKLDEI